MSRKWSTGAAWLWSLLAVVMVAPAQASGSTIVTSIRPLQWLVESLAAPGTPVLTLLPAGQSAHDYALRPRDVVTVQDSALLVWVGPAMEPWLFQLAQRLPAAQSLALMPVTGEQVEGRLQENPQGHGHTGHPAQHAGEHPGEALAAALTADPHVWLDPTRMAGLAELVAARLQQLYPDQHTLIQQRLTRFQLEMAQLDTTLRTQFAPVRDVGFVVYHDSYGPLVARYGLSQRGAVWHHETLVAGARDRTAMRDLLQGGTVACVFYEPEYGREAVGSWLAQQATGVKVAELDPLGGHIAGGEGAYSRLMHHLADSISQCLGSSPRQDTAAP